MKGLKKLKALLDSNSLCLGSWITIGDEKVTEILAMAGFDWLAIDLEHSTIDITKAGDLIRIVSLYEVTPLVRLTSLDKNQIKRVMDAGAGGIIVPNITSVSEATNAVAATKYAPYGSRGVGLARAQDYGNNFNGYLEWQRNGPIVIVQIENILALDKLEEIFNVRGISGFIIGPYDLSCSMGIPGQFENTKFKDVISRILSVGKKSGIGIGTHIVEPDLKLLSKSIKDGFNLIAYSVDIRMLSVIANQATEDIKKL